MPPELPPRPGAFLSGLWENYSVRTGEKALSFLNFA